MFQYREDTISDWDARQHYERFKMYAHNKNSKRRNNSLRKLYGNYRYAYEIFIDQKIYNFSNDEIESLRNTVINSRASISLFFREDARDFITEEERKFIFKHIINSEIYTIYEIYRHKNILSYEEQIKCLSKIVEYSSRDYFYLRELTCGHEYYFINVLDIENIIKLAIESKNFSVIDFMYEQMDYICDKQKFGDDTKKYFMNSLEPYVIARKLIGGIIDG